MAYITEHEREIVSWFGQIETEGKGHGATTRLDKLGTLAIALAGEANETAKAWLDYVKAQAPDRGARVTFCEHGTLVLVLPRYAAPEERFLEFPDAPTKSGAKGR